VADGSPRLAFVARRGPASDDETVAWSGHLSGSGHGHINCSLSLIISNIYRASDAAFTLPQPIFVDCPSTRLGLSELVDFLSRRVS